MRSGVVAEVVLEDPGNTDGQEILVDQGFEMHVASLDQVAQGGVAALHCCVPRCLFP